MSTIKKSYVELVSFLEANKDKKVSTILDAVFEMCESKKQSQTFIKDKEGKVIAIFCYYHKQWELLSEVEYGSKANSTTGYNTMCKVGTSKWTKAQSTAKKAQSELLSNVASGKVEPSNILKLQQDIEDKRTTMDVEDMPKGYESEEEVLKHIKK